MYCYGEDKNHNTNTRKEADDMFRLFYDSDNQILNFNEKNIPMHVNLCMNLCPYQI